MHLPATGPLTSRAQRLPRALALVLMLGLVAASVLVLPSAIARAADRAGAVTAAADDAAVAWSVETVDGPAGTDRPNFSFSVDPGAVLTDALRVTNTGTTPLDLAVYAADAFTTTTGNIDLNTLDVPSTDAGTWVSVGVDRLALQPGEQADIPFTITVPADASPGDHSAGIITSLTTGTGETLAVDRRLATRVDLRVSGALAPGVEVTGLSAEYVGTWNPFAPGTLVVDYRLENTGNTRIGGSDTVAAAGPFGLFGSTPVTTSLSEVLRGSAVDVHHEIEIAPWGLVAGTVTVRPEVAGFGAQPLDAVAVDFSAAAVPWALLAVFVVIAAIVVAVPLLVRRRRRLVAEGSAAAERSASAAG